MHPVKIQFERLYRYNCKKISVYPSRQQDSCSLAEKGNQYAEFNWKCM